MVQALRLKLL